MLRYANKLFSIILRLLSPSLRCVNNYFWGTYNEASRITNRKLKQISSKFKQVLITYENKMQKPEQIYVCGLIHMQVPLNQCYLSPQSFARIQCSCVVRYSLCGQFTLLHPYERRSLCMYFPAGSGDGAPQEIAIAKHHSVFETQKPARKKIVIHYSVSLGTHILYGSCCRIVYM